MPVRSIRYEERNNSKYHLLWDPTSSQDDFEGMAEASDTQCSTNALSTTTICAPTDILSPKYRFSLRRPRVTLYWKNGKVTTTDSPYAETKEQLGGIQILEARDLNHAVQLVSQQPGFKYGLGPSRDTAGYGFERNHKESERRRRKDTSR